MLYGCERKIETKKKIFTMNGFHSLDQRNKLLLIFLFIKGRQIKTEQLFAFFFLSFSNNTFMIIFPLSFFSFIVFSLTFHEAFFLIAMQKNKSVSYYQTIWKR